MQLHIDFSTDMLCLPISYNPMLQGFIYNALRSSDSGFSDFVHNEGREHGVNTFKLFTFGRLGGECRIKDKEIIFPSHASLEIRSPDLSIIEKIMSGCIKDGFFRLGKNAVKIEAITAENKKITESEVNAFCLSPFVYRMPFSECNTFYPDMAKNKIITNAREKWCCAGFDESDFRLEIEFPKASPEKVHCVFKNVYINAWNTPFVLRGNPETIDFLYNTGIGARNSQGFGMFGIKE